MNGFEKRSQRIKDKIMQTTLELLTTVEPKGLRIADIAAAAKVSQVTIYNHFGSKEGLLAEAFKTFIDKEIADFEAYMNEKHTLKEKIEFMIFQKKEAFHRFSLELISELLVDDRKMIAYVQQQYHDKVLALVVKYMEDGKRNGEISDRISIPTLIAFIEMMMKRPQELWDYAKRTGDIDRVLEEFMELLFYGIYGKH